MSEVYSKLRSNDSRFTCLRVIPSMSVDQLCRALATNSTIKQVVLSGAGNCFSVADFAALLSSMHHLPLMVLDVSGLELSEAHLSHVSHLLRECESVKRVDVSSNAFSAFATKQFAEVVAHHKSLRFLFMGQCNLRDEGLSVLFQELSLDRGRIERLDLSHNYITNISMNSISNYLKTNTSLQQFAIAGNFLSGDFVEKCIRSSLQQNGARSGKRPSSALGFLSTVESPSVACPSLNLLSCQVEGEVC